MSEDTLFEGEGYKDETVNDAAGGEYPLALFSPLMLTSHFV